MATTLDIIVEYGLRDRIIVIKYKFEIVMCAISPVSR